MGGYYAALAIAKAQAFSEWIATANVFPDVNGQLHAGPGGAIGMNGEHYEHGQFIATSEDTVKGALEIRKRARRIAFEEWTKDELCRQVAEWLEANREDLKGFLYEMAVAIETYGSLTQAQLQATIKARSAYLRRQQSEAERETENAKSEYLGTIGERMTFLLRVEKALCFESAYGLYHVNLCRAGDNVVVYKGSVSWKDDEGEILIVTATVKEHTEYQGTKQTIISRPKVVG